MNVQHTISFVYMGRRIRIAWLSFQPDGSISFGLSDRTHISPRFRARNYLWNAYNRIGIEYAVPSDPAALEPVKNPHFTFHPAVIFHLKGQNDLSSNDEDLFEGIADVGIVLQQQKEMPWLRATSQALASLPDAGPPRSGNLELIYTVPVVCLAASATIEIDFIRKEDVNTGRTMSPWEFVWHDVGLRVKAGFKHPQIATLSWFHFY
jgi:hypothetical protein